MKQEVEASRKENEANLHVEGRMRKVTVMSNIAELSAISELNAYQDDCAYGGLHSINAHDDKHDIMARQVDKCAQILVMSGGCEAL